MQSIEVEQSAKVCFDTHRCFVSKDARLETNDGQQNKTHLHCDGEDSTRCGVVVCKSANSGYYPSGFFSTRNGLCAFGTVLPVRSMVPLHSTIQENIGTFELPFFYIICLVVIFFRFPKMRQSISSAYLQGSSMSFRSVSSYGTDLQWSIRL